MRSLLARLLVGLIAAQVVAVMIAMILFPLMAPYFTYEDMAETTARRLAIASLRRADDGGIAIAPDEALRTYAAQRPQLKFAILHHATRRMAAGSDREMSDALERIAPFYPRGEGTLSTDRPGAPGQTIIISANESPFGLLVMASAGNRFGADDVGSFFLAFLPAMLPIYGPIFIGAFVFLPWFLRVSLRPLDRAARAAGAIDAAAARARLPTAGVLAEFLPLIHAVNAALDRLDDGLRRQRIYAANAAHELRTPVAILRARIDALPDPQAKAQLGRDAGRIGALVEQWLTVARLGHPEAAMDQDVELVALLRNIVADRAPLALRTGREIELQSAHDAYVARGNAASIESAIANLIDNALRAEPEDGAVIVRLARCGTVEIIDHGGGVPEALRSEIFEPFRRGRDVGPGAGLGLAIVKEVALRHGGSIEVTDTQGGGATFRFCIGATGNGRAETKETTI